VSRRIRDELIGLGIVHDGPAVTIADGTHASPGDLIIATRNNHHVEAGEPGRTLANGDLFRIHAVTPNGLIVRRALDADPRTGHRRWTDRPFLYADYTDAELGYAVTDHVAQGRTVHTGLAVITGTEDRPHAYVALTRGTGVNLAYVFTTSPTQADPASGPRPAPELARYDQISSERHAVRAPVPAPAPPGRALAVLSAVLDRDGQQLSATQTRHQALADADHLAVWHAIWTAETTPARHQHYQTLLRPALPPHHPTQPGHHARTRHPRHARRQAPPPARHLPHRNRLGSAVRRRRTPPGLRRRPRRPPGQPPRHRRSCSRDPSRRPPHRRPPAPTRRQLPGPAPRLPAARDRLRRHHGRPRRLGRRHPRPAPPSHRRRRRTPPPPPAQTHPPLRSAEPEATTQTQRAELTLTQKHRLASGASG
jgi:hypothetical protein